MNSNHTIRKRGGGTIEVKNYIRSLAIKLMCTECMGFGEEHPKTCADKLCPLFPFRGKSERGYGKRGSEKITEDPQTPPEVEIEP